MPAALPPPVLRIGCPMWAHEPWRGTLFTRGARREDYLPQYASVLGTAEGNASFYGLPSRETVARWVEEAPASFRFCWKFPRTITHDLQLVGAEAATQEFFERLAPLGERLGPFFLQLHSSYNLSRLRELEAYLRTLPPHYRYAAEVRHPEFFDGGEGERTIDALLRSCRVERVNFDTTAVFASTAQDEATLDARRRKPRVPRRTIALGRTPFVRFVGDGDLVRNDAAIAAWADVVARWLGEGRSPYFFVHTPDDLCAPELARRFQAAVHARFPGVPPPPPWPGESERREEQMGLF